MIKLKQARSVSNQGPINTIKQSDTINSYIMAAGVARSATVPAEATIVKFSTVPRGAEFLMNDRGTATINAGDITNGSASEPNPAIRTCIPGSTLSLISPSVCKIYLAYYN
jgi:hypothetical protein